MKRLSCCNQRLESTVERIVDFPDFEVRRVTISVGGSMALDAAPLLSVVNAHRGVHDARWSAPEG